MFVLPTPYSRTKGLNPRVSFIAYSVRIENTYVLICKSSVLSQSMLFVTRLTGIDPLKRWICIHMISVQCYRKHKITSRKLKTLWRYIKSDLIFLMNFKHSAALSTALSSCELITVVFLLCSLNYYLLIMLYLDKIKVLVFTSFFLLKT